MHVHPDQAVNDNAVLDFDVESASDKQRRVHCGDGQTKARLHPMSEREFDEALILCGSNRSTNAGAACRAFARIVKLLASN
jgi:hypothetical protein